MSSSTSHQIQLRSIKEPKLTESLPDEIWTKIFEIGIEKTNYSLRDIYSLLVSCKFFNRLWDDDALWSLLLTLDFPEYVNDDNSASQSYSSCKKLRYKYSLARYCKREFTYHERQFDKVGSRITVLYDRIERIQATMKTGSQFLEELKQKWRREIDQGRQAIALMAQAPFPSVAPTTSAPTTILPISAPCTTAPINSTTASPTSAPSAASPTSAPSAASPTSAPSFSNPTDHKSFLDSLVRLKTKIDDVLSFQQDKISTYERQRDRIFNLVRIQRDHCKQLETLSSCLATLSSGCNPIKMDDLEVDDEEADEDDDDEEADDDDEDDDDAEDVYYYDDDDDDGHDGDDFDSDNDDIEDGINGLPAE